MESVRRKAAIRATGLLAELGLWRRRSRTRAALRDLDDRLLRDIGLCPRARRRECAKQFWQA